MGTVRRGGTKSIQHRQVALPIQLKYGAETVGATLVSSAIEVAVAIPNQSACWLAPLIATAETMNLLVSTAWGELEHRSAFGVAAYFRSPIKVALCVPHQTGRRKAAVWRRPELMQHLVPSGVWIYFEDHSVAGTSPEEGCAIEVPGIVCNQTRIGSDTKAVAELMEY